MNLTGSVSSNLTFSLLKELNEILKDEKYYDLPILIDVNFIENENCSVILATDKNNALMLGLEQ